MLKEEHDPAELLTKIGQHTMNTFSEDELHLLRSYLDKLTADELNEAVEDKRDLEAQCLPSL